MDSEAVPAAPLAEWLQAPRSVAHSVPTRPQTHTVGTQQLGDPAPFDTHTHIHTHILRI